jgi:hypothetical protein
VNAAVTLNQIDSQVVHVKGDERLFSCYGFGHTVRPRLWAVQDGILSSNAVLVWSVLQILAFYSDMPGVDLELFDCFEADKSVELVNMELNRIVHSMQGMRRS